MVIEKEEESSGKHTGLFMQDRVTYLKITFQKIYHN